MLHRGSSCYVLLVLPVLTTVSDCTDSPKHSLNCNVQIDCMSLNTKIQGLFHLWNCWLWSNLDGNLIPWYPRRLNSMVLFLFFYSKVLYRQKKNLVCSIFGIFHWLKVCNHIWQMWLYADILFSSGFRPLWFASFSLSVQYQK